MTDVAHGDERAAAASQLEKGKTQLHDAVVEPHLWVI